MHQIDHNSAIAELPKPTPQGVSGYFTDGDPFKGVGATIVPAEFLNTLMLELLNVLKAADIQPDKSRYNQLAEAVQSLAGAASEVKRNEVHLRYPALGATDFNTITTPGHYALRSDEDMNASTNRPDTQVNGTLTVRAITERSVICQCFMDRENRVFVRTCSAGTWLPWQEVAHRATTLAGYGITDAVHRDEIVQFAVPSGAMMYFAMDKAPQGWLAANGDLLEIALYPALFKAIGHTYTPIGAIPPEGYFCLPDLRGEFIRGVDNGRGVDPNRTIGSWQYDELRSHTHRLRAGNYLISIHDVPGRVTRPDFAISYENLMEATGGNETRPRNIAMLACIKI